MATEPEPTVLVGRDREVGALRAACASAAAGHGRVVLIEGEPGIGKSRLVSTVCAEAEAGGFTVFAAVCDDLVTRPFDPLLAAFGVDGSPRDPARARIASLMTGDGRGPDTSPGAHYQLLDAFTSLVERIAARQQLLLAIDDLQWADESSLVTLRSIVRRADTLPVVAILSARRGHRNRALHRVADDLLRGGAVHIDVGPLDDASVARLAGDVLGSSPSDGLLARLQGAGGNPLFVIEYARSVGPAEVADVVAPTTATEFRHTVIRRLAALTPETNDVLRLAAFLGSTFSAADLAIASKQSMTSLVSRIQEAVAAGIIDAHGEDLAFRHALVRDAVYEDVPAGVRASLHREIGGLLAAGGADALTVAHHLGLGASVGDLEAVEWLRRAARDVATRSPATAVELLERARSLLPPSAPVREPLLAELAMALAWAGRLSEAEALSADVLARRPDPAVAGALRCHLVYALTWQGRPGEALRHATLPPDAHVSAADAALLKAEAAVASLLAFDVKRAGVLASEAAAAATALDHDLAHCHAMTALSWVSVFAGRVRDGVDAGRRAVEIADRSTSGAAHVAHPRFFLGGIPLLALDCVDEAEEVLRGGLRIAEQLGLAWSLPLYHAFLGSRGFIVGDWDGAIAECQAALAIADEFGLRVGTMAATAGWLAAIQLHRDALDDAERTLAAALHRLGNDGPQLGMGVLNWARAVVLDATGKGHDARRLLEQTWDLYMAGGPVADSWSTMTLVHLLLRDGERARVRSMLDPIQMPSRRPDATPFQRSVARWCQSLVEEDPDGLVGAVELLRGCRRPYERAAACEDAAAMLAAARRVEEAVPLWDEAVEVYEGLGAHRDLARVGSIQRAHGIRRGTRRPNVRATTGWESLTSTERKVVDLVAQRLSNPEVAERLFISRHTVESHLKSVYRKLRLSSRLDLAAVARRNAQAEG